MLPSPVRWIVRAAVPTERAETIVADLESEFAQQPVGLQGHWWLIRETGSLLVAYSTARVRRTCRALPLLTRDLQLAIRGVRRAPGALLASALLLAVGIAAALIAVGLTETLLHRQVSATYGERLRRVVAVNRDGRVASRFSWPELQAIREHVGDSGTVGAVYLQPVLLRVHHLDVQTMAEIVEGPYFTLTGIAPVIGRGLIGSDDRRESSPVTVISERFWRRQFSAAPSVLGTRVELNGTAYTVVGVMGTAGSSNSLGASVDAWVTAAHADSLLDAGWRLSVGDRWFSAFVLPTESHLEIESRLAVAAADLATRHADPWRERRLHTADATPVIGSQRTAATMLSFVLGGLAALIVLAAASNVSGVLFARAAANQRAAAIHLSIGAGRGTVLRRQLLEGGLIGFTAGVAAVALYAWVRAQLAEVSVLPTLALRLDLPLSLWFIALTLAGGIAVGLALAVAPALWSTRLDVAHALREGDMRGGSGPRAMRVRRALVSVQVCLSLVLVVGAALFVRSLDALARVDLGFARERLVAMDFDVEPVVRRPEDLVMLAREALDRVNALPAVVSAAMSNRAPVDASTPGVELHLPGDDGLRLRDVTMYQVTARYFDTVGVPLISGRTFTAGEVAGAADVAIVNSALAERLWPGEDPLDRAVYLTAEARRLRVVGVARDSKYRALTEWQQPHIYRPTPPSLGLTLLARTRDDPRETLRLMQRELDRVGPGVVGFFPRTFDDHLAVQLLPTRAAASAASVLGTLALALSAMSLYALVSWFVALRRREIGVRMALGASAGDVRRLVVRQAFGAAVPGLIMGTLLAIALGAVAQSALYGVRPTDPFAIGIGIGALAVVVLVAGYLPSRTATKVDPAITLR